MTFLTSGAINKKWWPLEVIEARGLKFCIGPYMANTHAIWKYRLNQKKKIFFGHPTLQQRYVWVYSKISIFVLILGGIYNVTIFYLATFFCTFINLYVLSKSCVDCKYSLLLSAVRCDLFSADWSTVNWGHFCGNIYTQIIPSNSDWPDSNAEWPILRRPINM